MDLQGFFSLNKNEEREQWEFTPNEKVDSVSYTIWFSDVDNEADAWIALYLAVQKSPEFKILA